MAFCGNCGASVGDQAQCHQCGSMNTESGGLELDDSALSHRPRRHEPLTAPTAAQIGGSGDRGVIDLGMPVQAPAPAPARDTRTFKERQADEMRDYWRIARIPVLLIVGWFTLSIVALGNDWIFVDNVNLAIHEAGHLFFTPFGQVAHFLGGTLTQLLFPLIFAAYFWRWRREPFSAAVCAWWFGQNFINIARYMADAVVQELPLAGGGIHDWTWLFSRWDVLDRCMVYARYTRWLGLLIMTASLGYLVYRTVRPSDDDVADGMDAPTD